MAEDPGPHRLVVPESRRRIVEPEPRRRAVIHYVFPESDSGSSDSREWDTCSARLREKEQRHREHERGGKWLPPRLPIVPRPSPPHRFKEPFGATWLPLPQRDPELEDLEPPPPWDPVPSPRVEPMGEQELQLLLNAWPGRKVEPVREEEMPSGPSTSKSWIKRRARVLLPSLGGTRQKIRPALKRLGGARQKVKPAAEREHREKNGRREAHLERQTRQGEYRPLRPPIQLPSPHMRITPLMRNTLERVVSTKPMCGREDLGEFGWPEPRRTRSVPPRRWQWIDFDTPILSPTLHYAQRWVFRTARKKRGQRRGLITPLFMT